MCKTRGSAKKALDKSEKSDIINIGSENVAEKEIEYGVPYGKGSVNSNLGYIYSDEYAKKFDNITNNADVNKTLLECSRAAIEHRNGTFREDMYIINANDGTILGKQLNCSADHGVNYNESINAALLKAKSENIPIIALHNHPIGVPPSADDFNKALENNYKFGVVAGHNGQVYLYNKPKKAVANPELLHNDIVYDIDILGIDVDRAYQKYYKFYELKYKIVKGVDNYD